MDTQYVIDSCPIALSLYNIDLREQSSNTCYKAYNNYFNEDLIREAAPHTQDQFPVDPLLAYRK